MEKMTRILTDAISMRDLYVAMRHTCSSTGVVVWYLDEWAAVTLSHQIPQSMTPCVMLNLSTGALDLFHGASFVKRIATLNPVRIC